MCGRYSLFTPPEALREAFDVEVPDWFEPTYNAAPGQSLPVIRDDAPGTLTRCSWGLLPGWADDPEDHPRPINARSETVAEKSTFREAYRCRRCLVPADGFYEWTQEGDRKRPYRVCFEDDRPFAMAGLWERWEGTPAQTSLGEFAGGDTDRTRTVESFTVLTTEPNDVVADLHDRMAVIVSPHQYDRWLSDENPSDLLDPYPDDRMRAYRVSTLVNDPKNDSPELIEPV